MILIAAAVVAIVWIVVLTVAVGLCASAAEGDRALKKAPSARSAAAPRTEPVARLRLIA